MLEVDTLTVRHGAVTALAGVSLRVGAGEAVALLGENGAGKTTLLRTVMGLHRPVSGTVGFDGRALSGVPPHRRARVGIGYCPEGRRVFPGLTVTENLLVACWQPARSRGARLDEVFALFPALRDRRSVRAWQLSGGQQQMLAIGRALMDGPRLLLLDEPSLGLSPALADEVFARIGAVAAAGVAVLLAESDGALARRVCGRVVRLTAGSIGRSAAEGAPEG